MSFNFSCFVLSRLDGSHSLLLPNGWVMGNEVQSCQKMTDQPLTLWMYPVWHKWKVSWFRYLLFRVKRCTKSLVFWDGQTLNSITETIFSHIILINIQYSLNKENRRNRVIIENCVSLSNIYIRNVLQSFFDERKVRKIPTLRSLDTRISVYKKHSKNVSSRDFVFLSIFCTVVAYF